MTSDKTTKQETAKKTPDLKHMLGQMLLIRRFEERAAQAYGLRKIGGFLHLYIGQEAVAVGSIAHLDLKRDYVYTAYRDHGHAIACGMDINGLMAELYGKEAGCSRGKGGSMHFFDKEKHFMGGNGIVGAHIKIWNLPVVFICENNQYGMGTDFRRVSSVEDFSIMGQSYGIPGKQVNGMDLLEVHKEVGEAVKRAKEEGTPSLLEIKTYRYKGHSMSDPAKYRTKEELEEYKNQDPILILKSHLLEKKLLTEDEFLKMDKTMKEQVKTAADYAEKSPEPELKSLYEDVLV
ncbi:MAG: pdha1, pdha, pdhce1a, phe1a [Marinimicrobia bacterium 46_43]|nr:MAG: pdha1, pdha, pdhce1a, phe1a [Marinimicrobia bacterium 46_43]